MVNDLLSLKSGTDIRGVAVEGVEGEFVNLTDEILARIIVSFAFWLSKEKNKNVDDLLVAIGHDSRISAGRIKNVLINTLGELGVKIFDCGLSSTPAMFMTIIDLKCDASIEITASHHPFNRNGLKFFTKDGGLDSSDIEEILINANSNFKFVKHDKCLIEKINYMKIYSQRLRKIICEGIGEKEETKPLKGFKIIVDAGNGVGGFFATEVLEYLGADISGSQFLEPDGKFPNHMPNPEDKIAVASVVKAVLKNHADLGIIFDTDVDRAGAIDCNGDEICGNSLIALAAHIFLKENAGGTIVTDSVTSDGIREYIESELKGVHNRFKRGYKNVINEAKRLNLQGINCPLAIETSGHAAMRENYFLDDGAYLITKIIVELVNLKKIGKNFSDVLKKLKKPKESKEFRLEILCRDFKLYGEKIINDLIIYAKNKESWKIAPDNKEGIRISFDKNKGDGWLLLRMSVHDPVMPLNIESNLIGGAKIILHEFYDFIEKYDNLNITSLKVFLEKINR